PLLPPAPLDLSVSSSLQSTMTATTLAALPHRVLVLIAKHVLHACEVSDLDQLQKTQGVPWPLVRVDSLGARSLAELRKTCKSWMLAADEVLQCHLELKVATEVTKANDTRLLRLKVTPNHDQVSWAPANLAVMQLHDYVGSVSVEDGLVDVPNRPAVLRVPNFSSQERFQATSPPPVLATLIRWLSVLAPDPSPLVIPAKYVHSLTIVDSGHGYLSESGYLSQTGLGKDFDNVVHHEALSVLLEHTVVRFPHLMTLNLGHLVLPASALLRPLALVAHTLVVLQLAVPNSWSAEMAPLAMPLLREFRFGMLKNPATMEKGSIGSCLIIAPALQTLALSASRVETQFFRNYLSRRAATLHCLVLDCDVEPTFEDLIQRTGACTTWSELRYLDAPIMALFMMIRGAKLVDNPLPQLASLKLHPTQSGGVHVPPMRLPVMPQLAHVELTRFVPLHATLLQSLSTAAPCLAYLKLDKCRLAFSVGASTAVSFLVLEKLVLDQSFITNMLVTTINAPRIKDVTIVVNSSNSLKDVALWSTISELTVVNPQLHDAIQLRAENIGAIIPRLSKLQLYGRIEWADQSYPLLQNITTLVVGAETANELARMPSTLCQLVDLEIDHLCSCCNNVLDFVPASGRLQRLKVPSLHARAFEQALRLPKLKILDVGLVRNHGATPMAALTLEFDQQRLPWSMVPKFEHRVASRLVVKIARITNVQAAMVEMEAMIRAIAVEPQRGRKEVLAMPLDVILEGLVHESIVGALGAMLMSLEREGYVQPQLMAHEM
ncbi:hypothetical protein AMAG_09498, partial [Allomyces macrogynus ATCC 38327]